MFDETRTYRYTLWRVWDLDKPYLNVIGLNPSTADETILDPTCTRCRNLAERLGFGGYWMTNIFALRSTDPKILKTARAPIFPQGDNETDPTIWHVAERAGMVICAWGNYGEYRDRGLTVEYALRQRGVPLHYLGITKRGQPRHPLYLLNDVLPVPWRP